MFLNIDGNKVFALSFGAGPRTILAHSGWIGNFEVGRDTHLVRSNDNHDGRW